MEEPAVAPPPKVLLSRAGAVIGGRYRLRTPIGAGAMGEVWAAEHVTLGTTVALKLVDTQGRADAAEILGRFALEARAVAQIKSPHVVAIHDHGADGSIAFMAMELLEGESLDRRLARRGILTPSEVAHVLREIARGVERAHAAGVVHRDLKPANVFIARNDGVEVVKVLDFGVAKMLGVEVDEHLRTQAGFVVGTPTYMSPEQVLGQPLDHRSDLWQLAVLAFECTTGRCPFVGATLGQLFLSICNAPLPVPSQCGPASEAFDAWFARACSRDPAARFQSARALASALGEALAPGGVGESAIATVATTKARPSPAQEGGRAHAPGATGHVAAWSASPEAPSRASRGALVAGFLLAPTLALVAGGAFLLMRGGVSMGAAPPHPASAAVAPVIAPAPSAAAVPPTATASALATPASGAPPAVSAVAPAALPTGRPVARPTPAPRRNTGRTPIDLGI